MSPPMIASITRALFGAALTLVCFAPSYARASDGHSGWIAYTHGTASGSSEIFEIRLDGSGLRRVTRDGNNSFATWLPDGTRLSWVHRSSIVIARPDGTGAHTITAAEGTTGPLSWSPDGRRVAYQSGSGICVVGINGRDRRCIAKTGDSPLWSSDGKYLAYTVRGTDEGEYPALEVVRAIGGSPMDLGFSTGGSWSPHGHNLAYDCGWPDSTDLCWTDLHGRRHILWSIHPALYNNAPVWSPDGAHIAFPVDERIWLFNIADQRAIRLTYQRSTSAPTWSPNGSVLLFVRRPSAIASHAQIFRVRGRKTLALTRGPIDTQPAWQPKTRKG